MLLLLSLMMAVALGLLRAGRQHASTASAVAADISETYTAAATCFVCDHSCSLDDLTRRTSPSNALDPELIDVQKQTVYGGSFQECS
jgi:hypothetical protein